MESPTFVSKRIKMRNLAIHIGVWLSLLILRITTNDSDVFIENLILSIVLYGNNAIVFYLASSLQRFVSVQKKYTLFILGILGLVIFGTIIAKAVFELLNSKMGISIPVAIADYGFIRVTFWLILGNLYQVVIFKRKAEYKQKEILLEKRETEIQLLKTQMNPHFFFNTLNNIYGLTFNKDDKAPKVVLMLSNAMRYILYETKDEFVPVQKEIEFVKNYIELERLRILKPDNVEFTANINISTSKIAPLILLPFIENCFKHGNTNNTTNFSIQIRIWEEGDCLFFSTENTFAEDKPKKPGGIGTKNVQKRLELMYGDSFELELNSKENRYYVFLKLPLQNN